MPRPWLAPHSPAPILVLLGLANAIAFSVVAGPPAAEERGEPGAVVRDGAGSDDTPTQRRALVDDPSANLDRSACPDRPSSAPATGSAAAKDGAPAASAETTGCSPATPSAPDDGAGEVVRP